MLILFLPYKLKSKADIQKVPLEVSENVYSALPYISGDVYVQSNDGPFQLGVQSDDIAYMCIWGQLVDHYWALRPNSSNLKY